MRSDLLPPDTLEQRVKEDKEDVREPLVQSALLAGNKEPHVQQDWIPVSHSSQLIANQKLYFSIIIHHFNLDTKL